MTSKTRKLQQRTLNNFRADVACAEQQARWDECDKIGTWFNENGWFWSQDAVDGYYDGYRKVVHGHEFWANTIEEALRMQPAIDRIRRRVAMHEAGVLKSQP